jgi:hypothetical protein
MLSHDVTSVCYMNFRVPLCQFFSFVFGYIWLHVLTPPSTDITQHYTLGVWAICLSCVIEMCCEPVYLVAQAFLFVRFKVMAVQLINVYWSLAIMIKLCMQKSSKIEVMTQNSKTHTYCLAPCRVKIHCCLVWPD